MPTKNFLPTKNFIEPEVLEKLEFEKPILHDARWIMKGEPDPSNGKEFYHSLNFNELSGEFDGLNYLWKIYHEIIGH